MRLIAFLYIDGILRLRVVSNFGDGDCGAGEIHTRARAKFRGDATRRERRKFSALPSRRVASKFRARACVYFARPTIAIAKIGDYSQSTEILNFSTTQHNTTDHNATQRNVTQHNRHNTTDRKHNATQHNRTHLNTYVEVRQRCRKQRIHCGFSSAENIP